MFQKYKPIFISAGLIVFISILLYRLILAVLLPGTGFAQILLTKKFTPEGLVQVENGWQFQAVSSTASFIIPADWGRRQGPQLEQFTKLGEVSENWQFGADTQTKSIIQYINLKPADPETYTYIASCVILTGECENQRYNDIEFVKLTQTPESGVLVTQIEDQIILILHTNLDPDLTEQIMNTFQI